jgi:ArsR family transcriptional regulator
VEAQAAPVLELTYAYYYLLSIPERKRESELFWVTELERDHPELLRDLTGFWGGQSAKASGYDLFVLSGELGYAWDEGAERFLNDLPELPERMLHRVESAHERHDHEVAKWAKDEYEAFGSRLEQLQQPERGQAFSDLLTRLWQVLAPHWDSEGREIAEKACQTFRREFTESGDVLKALPPHHFTQFEISALQIRTSQERGRILVAPLYFAGSGGFNNQFSQTHFIGYGLSTESLFEDSNSRLDELATRFKAFSDPTRLMLLGFIARWHRMPLTVGDLAVQLGVSQPTVSGHLKILREAGFVTVEKKGNRSFHQVDAEAVRSALAAMDSTLLKYIPEP